MYRVSIPLIDFIWRGGIICPEFIRHVLTSRYALLEKCVIYDGGARRFNIAQHVNEVVEFWQNLLQKASDISFDCLLEEKLGHSLDISFNEWVQIRRFNLLPVAVQEELYSLENNYIEEIKKLSLAQIAELRLTELKQIYGISI